MKVWSPVLGFLLGIVVGVAAGFALEDPAGVQEHGGDEVAAVPDVCVEAITAARDRLLLNPDVTQTLRDYRALGQEIGAEVSDLSVPDLRKTLSELNDLNDRSAELIDRSVNARFSAAANECEEIAATRTRSDPAE